MSCSCKYYSSPRITAEAMDCSMPVTFDTYNNCSFGCLYCFSAFQRGINQAIAGDYLAKEVRAVSVERVKKMFLDPDAHAGKFKNYIKDRRVMQWGGLSDQFDGFERKFGKTLELLRFFKEIDYPLCFSTKATWFTKDERYMELIRGQKNWNFKFSIITLEEDKARAIERGVPSPNERLAAIERIANADAGGATLRLRPFIIGVSTPTYTDLIKTAGERGATALSTEFLCIDVRSSIFMEQREVFKEQCGFDIVEFYKKHSDNVGYLRLCRSIKKPFVENMKKACEQAGMRFYVSDAHFKELCNNGSCCGLPESWAYSRGQYCEALQIAKKNGVVHFSDIKKDCERYLGDCKAQDSQNFGNKYGRAKFLGLSLPEYLRYLWNTPTSKKSPCGAYGHILLPDGIDENGDVIYKYNQSETI